MLDLFIRVMASNSGDLEEVWRLEICLRLRCAHA